MKTFKKFKQYINEESDEKSDSSIEEKCDRCGEAINNCKCFEEDYYDATLKHYTPKGQTKKGKDHG